MENPLFTRFKLGPDDWLVRYNGGEPLARAYCFHAGGGSAKWLWATWTYPSSNGFLRRSQRRGPLMRGVRAILKAGPPRHR